MPQGKSVLKMIAEDLAVLNHPEKIFFPTEEHKQEFVKMFSLNFVIHLFGKEYKTIGAEKIMELAEKLENNVFVMLETILAE